MAGRTIGLLGVALTVAVGLLARSQPSLPTLTRDVEKREAASSSPAQPSLPTLTRDVEKRGAASSSPAQPALPTLTCDVEKRVAASSSPAQPALPTLTCDVEKTEVAGTSPAQPALPTLTCDMEKREAAGTSPPSQPDLPQTTSHGIPIEAIVWLILFVVGCLFLCTALGEGDGVIVIPVQVKPSTLLENSSGENNAPNLESWPELPDRL